LGKGVTLGIQKEVQVVAFVQRKVGVHLVDLSYRRERRGITGAYKRALTKVDSTDVTINRTLYRSITNIGRNSIIIRTSLRQTSLSGFQLHLTDDSFFNKWFQLIDFHLGCLNICFRRTSVLCKRLCLQRKKGLSLLHALSLINKYPSNVSGNLRANRAVNRSFNTGGIR